MKLYKSSHSVYKTQYHIVWVTKFRKKILSEGVQAFLRLKLEEVRKYFEDWRYVEIGIDVDHIHLHMVIPPKYAVSYVIETLKKNTSRELRSKFDFINQAYIDKKGIWSTGYFVSTVGINEETIRRYVSQQGKEDTGQAELEL